MFVEPGAQTSLTVQDKRWVGNWWLGFAIFGAICVFWSIWLLGFPKEFPMTRKRRESEVSQPKMPISAVGQFYGSFHTHGDDSLSRGEVLKEMTWFAFSLQFKCTVEPRRTTTALLRPFIIVPRTN